ncbi:helix-turn-helix domain-containing protein [Salmonirosea aquatica]|uniref:Helix-turn-helix domain-containing protein n=1 Tax=Salmonirosea aquatica TaxID=2654236 RepID=A0A7C9FBW4_9BACT|nr:helix-turn-helix domain-containing protein [Cytophagaceae bacterium SJW1-29]
MEPIKPIKTEQDYDAALKELESVLHAKPNTPEGDLLEVLSLLVHEYEQKHYKIELLTPLEALKHEMEEQGLTQSDLAKRFAMSKSTISEILNGRKQMSVRFMKYLYHDLGIPAQVLLS